MSSHAESLDAFEELASKYELLEELGGGGMGRVLHARHRQLKQHVAIKLLQRDLASAEATARFLREACAVAKIQSPHVARVMDAGVSIRGQPYIVMEYLVGRDLARVVDADGPLPVADAVDYVLQALAAIAEAHTLGIIHRDLKPSNLFATQVAGDEILIKVLDFGLAKLEMGDGTLDPLTERGGVLGTPSYMAPEQFVDAQSADARSDLWSMGATLFQLFSRVPPFRGGSLLQLYTAVMHGAIPRVSSLRPEVCAELDTVIATCLQRDREERYQTAAELAFALEPHGGPMAANHVQRIARLSRTSSIRTKPVPALAPGERGSSDTPLASSAMKLRALRRPLLQPQTGIGIAIGLLGVLLLGVWTHRHATSAIRRRVETRARDEQRNANLPPSAASAQAAGDASQATPKIRDVADDTRRQPPPPSAASIGVPAKKTPVKHTTRPALAGAPSLSSTRAAPALYERYP